VVAITVTLLVQKKRSRVAFSCASHEKKSLLDPLRQLVAILLGCFYHRFVGGRLYFDSDDHRVQSKVSGMGNFLQHQ